MLTHLSRSVLAAATLAIAGLTLAGGGTRAAGPEAPHLATAVFGAGCYWCTEADFDKVDGVVATTSGFMGGKTPDPTYEQVGYGGTGHVEVVEVRYDPAKVTYERLLDHYWRHVDFEDGGGQFCDRGDQYRPVIFVADAVQTAAAEASKAAIARKFDRKPVAVAIEMAATFYAGPAYHQDYYKTNALKYQYYRWGCGRDKRIEELWQGGKSSN